MVPWRGYALWPPLMDRIRHAAGIKAREATAANLAYSIGTPLLSTVPVKSKRGGPLQAHGGMISGTPNNPGAPRVPTSPEPIV